MNSINHKRKAAMIHRILSEIITEEVKNRDINYPTLTAVKLSNDSGHVLAYVTFTKNSEKSLESLNKAKGFVKSRLAALSNLRRVPDIDFKIDDSLERVAKIDEILKKIKEEKK